MRSRLIRKIALERELAILLESDTNFIIKFIKKKNIERKLRKLKDEI